MVVASAINVASVNLMQKILLVALLSVTSTSALALDLNPYIEGQVGHIDAKTIDTQTYSGTFNGSSLSSKLRLKYDSDISWSGEVGLKDVGIPNLRIGAAYTHAAIDLNQLSLLANGSTAIKDSAGTTVCSVLKVFETVSSQMVHTYLSQDERVISREFLLIQARRRESSIGGQRV